MFEYRARVVRVYDGDTIFCRVDLGFGVKLGMDTKGVSFRLYGVDTPELNRKAEREAGIVARDWLREHIEGKDVILRTHKPDPKDKYGRYLAEVILDGVNLNELLVEEGHAVAYFGGKKKR